MPDGDSAPRFTHSAVCDSLTIRAEAGHTRARFALRHFWTDPANLFAVSLIQAD